jgi:cell division protein FtsL
MTFTHNHKPISKQANAIVLLIISFTLGFLVSLLIISSQYEHLITQNNKDIFALEQQLNVANQTIDDSNLDTTETIKNLKLQLRLVADGASIEEAQQIVEVASEAGVSPKF